MNGEEILVEEGADTFALAADGGRLDIAAEFERICEPEPCEPEPCNPGGGHCWPQIFAGTVSAVKRAAAGYVRVARAVKCSRMRLADIIARCGR